MKIFIKELKILVRPTFFWILGMSVLVILGMMESAGAQGMSADDLSEMIGMVPDVVLALFGMNDVDLSSPIGYFAILSYYIAIVSGLYGVSLGGGAIYNEQMMKTGEFLYTKPMPRALILIYKLAARFLVFLVYLIALNLVSMVALWQVEGGGEFIAEAFHLNLVSFNIGVVMICVSLFVASFLHYGHELSGIANYIVGIFFLTGFVYELTELEMLRILSPLKYVVYSDVLSGDIQHSLIFGTSALALVVAAVGILVFSRKEAT